MCVLVCLTAAKNIRFVQICVPNSPAFARKVCVGGVKEHKICTCITDSAGIRRQNTRIVSLFLIISSYILDKKHILRI